MWPFKPNFKTLTPIELRSELIAAAHGPKRRLRALCDHYRAQIISNVELLCKAPDDLPKDSGALERYVQSLGAVAQFLASECETPQLWERLCGTTEDNPLLRWDQWYAQLNQRMQQLAHDQLIQEAQEFLTQARSLEGAAAKQNEVFLTGRLGELQFHSGRVEESIIPFQAALAMCQAQNDTEGEAIYLNNLLEAYRYLGRIDEAIAHGEALLDVHQRQRTNATGVERQLQRLRHGEPLCRVVCVRDGQQWELKELSTIEEGAYQFQFRRNRMCLQKCTTLVDRGNAAASDGNVADAMIFYEEAMDVDPHDPDPRYQTGMCLMDLGAFAKAQEVFDEVERLAPGWFQCRFYAWLAQRLDDGSVSEEPFRILRLLDSDGILTPKQFQAAAEKATCEYPDFAPFQLVLGDSLRQAHSAAAIAAYRRGLQLPTEPDLESRLRCALAGCLPAESPEREQILERTQQLRGNLVAIASARLMQVAASKT